MSNIARYGGIDLQTQLWRVRPADPWALLDGQLNLFGVFDASERACLQKTLGCA